MPDDILTTVDAPLKVCTGCGEEKPLSSFYDTRRNRCGKLARCKPCHYADNKRYQNKEQAKQKSQVWYQANREKHRDLERLRRHNLPGNCFRQMLEDQNFGCAICGRVPEPGERSLVVDHDHDSGIIRGLLCDSHNKGLGHFFDSIPDLEQAIAYLTRVKNIKALFNDHNPTSTLQGIDGLPYLVENVKPE